MPLNCVKMDMANIQPTTRSWTYYQRIGFPNERSAGAHANTQIQMISRRVAAKKPSRRRCNPGSDSVWLAPFLTNKPSITVDSESAAIPRCRAGNSIDRCRNPAFRLMQTGWIIRILNRRLDSLISARGSTSAVYPFLGQKSHAWFPGDTE